MYRCSKKLATCKEYSFLTIVAFQHIQCLYLMYAETALVLVSLGAQIQPQVILDPDCLSDYLSASYDYDEAKQRISRDLRNRSFLFSKLI